MDKLTREHAAWLWHRLAPQLRFYAALKRKLERRGYLPSDPLYRDVAACYDAIHGLRVAAHYGSCESGVFGASSRSFGDATPDGEKAD